MGDNVIKVGDMVGFVFRGNHRLAIITEDLGKDWNYGRFTGLLIGGDGDLVPLNPEEITVLSTPSQVDGWEKKKNLQKILDKNK